VESHQNAVEAIPESNVPSPKSAIDGPLPKADTITKAFSVSFSFLLRNCLPDDI
jgi:hypothetical protein